MISSFVFSKNFPIITWQRAGGHGKKIKSKNCGDCPRTKLDVGLSLVLSLISQPVGEFFQAVLNLCGRVVAKLFNGFGNISVSSFDIAGLRGQVLPDGLFAEGLFNLNNQVIDRYRS